jgi:CHASE3 domain sensor protein
MLLVYRTTGQVQDSLELTRHTQDILVRLGSVSTDLVELETGQRGYLLTGDEHYLQPYLAALGRLDGDLAALTALLAGNEPDAKRLAALGGLVMQKRDELARTIELRKTQGLEAALLVVRTGEGQKSMDALRRFLGDMAREQNRLLDIRKEREQRDVRMGIVAASLIALLPTPAVTGVRADASRDEDSDGGGKRPRRRGRHWLDAVRAVSFADKQRSARPGNW